MRMIAIMNQEENDIYNREQRLDRRLRKRGYRLSHRKDGCGVTMYTVVNMETNVIEAGEYVLSLEEMEAWADE